MTSNGDIVNLSDDDEGVRATAGSQGSILLSQQRGEDLEDSDEDDIFLGDIGIDEKEDDDIFGSGPDGDMFLGMKRGRGTRLLTIGVSTVKPVKAIGDKRNNSNNAWTRPVRLSASLASFLGVEAIPRTDVTKKVWAYIKEHNLQNPANKREILCDSKLQSVLGVPCVNMFSMTKILSKHMFKDDEVSYLEGDEEFRAAKRLKGGKAVKEEMDEWDASGKKTKKDLRKEGKSAKVVKDLTRGALVAKGAKLLAQERKKKADKLAKKAAKKAANKADREAGRLPKRDQANNPFMKPLALSSALSKLLGGETSMPRPTVVKRMWERIRERGLQNPCDKREILCDEEMKACFGVGTMTMFSMNKYLKSHLTTSSSSSSSSSGSSSTSSSGGGSRMKAEGGGAAMKEEDEARVEVNEEDEDEEEAEMMGDEEDDENEEAEMEEEDDEEEEAEADL